MEPLLAALLLWIDANSDYSTIDIPLPQVVVMTPVELTREFYSDVPELIPAGEVDERVLALYAFDDGSYGTIYVRDCRNEGAFDFEEEDCDDPAYLERLLHELVHHVQRFSGVLERFPCRNFGEKEAYLLGGRYLKARYFTDPLPNRNFWAHVYSRC